MAQGVRTEPDEGIETEFPNIPGYTILESIGRGGMGAVFRARQESLDREVAIKLLANTQIDGGMLFERLGREARAMAKLRHASIVAVYDFIELSEVQAAIVMELIEGDSLRSLLKKYENGLPLELAKKLGTEIGEALAFAHENGIVHRDVKPENILIDRDGSAKVSDFGLAFPLGEQSTRFTVSGTTVGTLGYMAPEQLDGSEVDARADLYSLGVILCEMLTGVRPQGNVDPPHQLKPEIPRPMSEAVMRALRQKPEERFDSVQQLLAAFQTGKSARPRRKWLSLLVILAAVAGLVAGLAKKFDWFQTDREWRSVLNEVELERDQIRGFWRRDGGDFISDNNLSLLRIPVNPGTSYDVRFSFTRVGGTQSVALFFRTARGMGSLEFDAWDQPGLSGVQQIDNAPLDEGGGFEYTTLDNQRHEFVLEVRPESIRVRDADGNTLGDYEIGGSRLSVTYPWMWSGDEAVDFIVIGSYSSETRFHEVLWRPAR